MVSDSKDINPRTVRAHNLGPGSVTTAKAGKKIMHTESADPTTAADGGTGYEVGCLWNNTASGQVFVCTSSSEEDSVWRGQDGDDVNFSPAWQALSHGYETGGGNPYNSDEMSRWPIAAPYPTADIGTLPAAMFSLHAGVYGSTLFIAGGKIHPSVARSEVASFPAAASTSITDIGEMAVQSNYAGSGWSATKGYVMAGQSNGSATDVIQDYTFASPFTATDVAEHANDKENPSSHDDETYTFNCMGGPPYTDMITRYAKSTTDNSTDVGEAVISRHSASGNSDNTNGYGFISGGGAPEVNTLQRFPFSSPSSAADVAEHAAPMVIAGNDRGVSTLTHGHIIMRDGPASTNERFSFTSPYPSVDVGEAHDGVWDQICCHGV